MNIWSAHFEKQKVIHDTVSRQNSCACIHSAAMPISLYLLTPAKMFYVLFVVILFLVLLLILRTVYVLKKKRDQGSLDRRKSAKVMVVAGSGTLIQKYHKCFSFAKLI